MGCGSSRDAVSFIDRPLLDRRAWPICEETNLAGATMPSPSEATRDTYDKVTIRLHWATALLVALLWLMGQTISFLPRGPLRVDLWSVHVLLGFTLVGVLAARIFWRTTYGRTLPPADHGVRHLLAMATHRLLYLLLLAVVALGVINVFAHAFPLFNVWDFPKLGDDDLAHSINGWHGLVANVIAAVALFHAAAALFHHYVIRDVVLGRMWPSIWAARREAIAESAQRTPQSPG
jgi:cytochrome b561